MKKVKLLIASLLLPITLWAYDEYSQPDVFEAIGTLIAYALKFLFWGGGTIILLYYISTWIKGENKKEKSK